MARKPQTSTQLAALLGTLLTETGVEIAESGRDPHWEWLMQSMYALSTCSASWFKAVKDDADDTTLLVLDGSANLDGTFREFTQATISLAAYNNDVAFVWMEVNGGNLEIDATDEATGWPTTPHTKIAEVTVTSGAFEESDIVDRRPASLFRQIPNIAKLDQTITNPPTQAETQAISDKVDEILDALISSDQMSTT